MKHAICPSCGGPCIKYGKNKSGTQRWRCNACSMIITPKFDNAAKQLQVFLKWLFGKQTQREMPAEGRTFRRKAKQFWEIWPMPPQIESEREVVFVDGIYMGRKACVLICCDAQHVLGWYLCSMSIQALIRRYYHESRNLEWLYQMAVAALRKL